MINATGKGVGCFAVSIAVVSMACTGSIDDGKTGSDPQEPSATDIGESPILRLTRVEYQRTVRDLFRDSPAVVAYLDGPLGPLSSLARDGLAGPFDSNASIDPSDSSIGPYGVAAEDIAAAAISDFDSWLPCASAADLACGEALVADVGMRAYRRPLDADEQAGLVALFELGHEGGGFANGVRLVLEAMLQSPHFLYRVEVGTETTDPTQVRLDGYEVASRLSYFLWKSMPDDELFAAVAEGKLSSVDEIGEQARRMLGDPKAEFVFAEFHAKWLGVDDESQLSKDTEAFPDYTDTLGRNMIEETRAFVSYVMREGDGRLETLLTAPYTVANQRVAETVYGIVWPGGSGFQRIDLDPGQRAGLLTQPSFLAAYSYPDMTSPVHRGLAVRERFLCQNLPPPPEDLVPPEPTAGATRKEQLASYQTGTCRGCHQLMDLIGFGFESYDALGRHRTKDGTAPIDDTGEMVNTVDIDGSFQGAVQMAEMLAASDEVRRCASTQWFRFAHGRNESEADRASIDMLDEQFAASSSDLRELLLAITTNDGFRFRKISQ